MLHFIFYDYSYKFLKKKKLKISEEKIWEISEIFNTLVLNRKEFKTLIKPSKELGYPEHKKYIRKISSKLRNGCNIDDFLKLFFTT
jgi:hypothetical protein